MLLVKARAGISSIHGIGLIAQEFIPAGTIIWEFQPGFDVAMTMDQLDELSETAREQAIWYGWLDESTNRWLLTSDDDRFTNHSDCPNTIRDGRRTIAARDIALGEEITNNYRELPGQSSVFGS